LRYINTLNNNNYRASARRARYYHIVNTFLSHLTLFEAELINLHHKFRVKRESVKYVCVRKFYIWCICIFV